jgi:hypothetical protein
MVAVGLMSGEAGITLTCGAGEDGYPSNYEQ